MALFLIAFQLSNPEVVARRMNPHHRALHSSFDHWFSIEIRGPVHQVEGPKKHWEHYPGHLINLAHTVVSLFGVWGLGFRWFELNSCAI